MKKSVVYILSALVITAVAWSKKTPVPSGLQTDDTYCERLKAILQHAYNSFEDINTKTDAIPDDPTGEDEDTTVNSISLATKASLDFPGAKASSIVMGLFTPDEYSAYFGTYKTKAEADKKINSLKPQLTNCLKEYTLITKPGKADGVEYAARYLFDEKKQANASPRHVELVMMKSVIKIKKKPSIIYKVYINISGLKE